MCTSSFCTKHALHTAFLEVDIHKVFFKLLSKFSGFATSFSLDAMNGGKINVNIREGLSTLCVSNAVSLVCGFFSKMGLLVSPKWLVRAAQGCVARPKTHWCTHMQVDVRMRGCCFTPRGCSWSGLVTSWIIGTLDAHAQHCLIEVTWLVSRVRRSPLDACCRLEDNSVLVEGGDTKKLVLLACGRIQKAWLIVKNKTCGH